MKYLKLFESHSDYLKWKRRNVTIRGIRVFGKMNGSFGSLGDGLYTAFLSNSHLAKQYGKVYFVLGAIPKNPKFFDDKNQAEIWLYHRIVSKYEDFEDFDKKTTIKDEMLKLGYDGVVVRGREMVNYTPDMDNILYFSTERELENYYEFQNTKKHI